MNLKPPLQKTDIKMDTLPPYKKQNTEGSQRKAVKGNETGDPLRVRWPRSQEGPQPVWEPGVFGLKVLSKIRASQRAQYPLIKEYSLNHNMKPCII